MVDNNAKRTVEKLLRQQAALAAFGSFAFKETNLLAIIAEAARICAASLEVPYCKVCRYRPEENDLLIEAGYGWEDGVVGRVVSQADETSPQGRAYVTGEPVIIRDVRETNNLLLPDFYPQHGVISTVDVVIATVDGPPYGVLEIDSPTLHQYDEHDINFLTGFANVLAEAVATAQKNEALRALLEQQKLLADAMRANLLGEQETSALREQFIAVLGHDLRNPLMSISLGAQLLLRRPEQADAIVGGMLESASKMSGLINDVLDFARGRLGGGLDLTRNADEALEPTLRQVIDELHRTMPDRAIEIDIAVTGPISCDRSRIGQLFSNLLGNALTHGSAVEPVRVQVRTFDGFFELRVSNAGEPISPAALKHLFMPFFRGAVRPSQGGLGLGLYIAAEIARAHNGTLEVSSTQAETRFTFRMPLNG